MELKTFRAKSLPAALDRVRRELGPTAAVLHTRELRSGGWWRWVGGGRVIEVTASAELPRAVRTAAPQPIAEVAPPPLDGMAGIDLASRGGAGMPADLRRQLLGLQSLVEDLCRRTTASAADIPESLFTLFSELIETEMSEELARELIERARAEHGERLDQDLVRARRAVLSLVEADIRVAGPIRPAAGRRHLVALVGPTGVGKTTTIAKLAAHYRLRERLRVGLITVDTYRIAAVEQLRTYADIIDLPMEVVATPGEMRQAVNRLADLDLVLMDTAGRSPRDEVKIQELQTMLATAQPDEVHLVLSCTAGATGLAKSAERFAGAGTTSLILTKLDEATGLGNLLPLLRSCRLPLSYLTNGQNVPDDIEPADAPRLARRVLSTETAAAANG